jgi:hypothetical protein
VPRARLTRPEEEKEEGGSAIAPHCSPVMQIFKAQITEWREKGTKTSKCEVYCTASQPASQPSGVVARAESRLAFCPSLVEVKLSARFLVASWSWSWSCHGNVLYILTARGVRHARAKCQGNNNNNQY